MAREREPRVAERCACERKTLFKLKRLSRSIMARRSIFVDLGSNVNKAFIRKSHWIQSGRAGNAWKIRENVKVNLLSFFLLLAAVISIITSGCQHES